MPRRTLSRTPFLLRCLSRVPRGSTPPIILFVSRFATAWDDSNSALMIHLHELDQAAEETPERPTTTIHASLRNPPGLHPHRHPHTLVPKAFPAFNTSPKSSIFSTYNTDKSLADAIFHIANSQGFARFANTDIFLKRMTRIPCFFFLESFYETGEHLVGFTLPNKHHPGAMDFATAIAKAPYFCTPCTDADLNLFKVTDHDYRSDEVDVGDPFLEDSTAAPDHGGYAGVRVDSFDVHAPLETCGVEHGYCPHGNGCCMPIADGWGNVENVPIESLRAADPILHMLTWREGSGFWRDEGKLCCPHGLPDPRNRRGYRNLQEDPLRRVGRRWMKYRARTRGRIQKEIDECVNWYANVADRETVKRRAWWFRTACRWVRKERERCPGRWI